MRTALPVAATMAAALADGFEGGANDDANQYDMLPDNESSAARRSNTSGSLGG